jgi:hypothetical protein
MNADGSYDQQTPADGETVVSTQQTLMQAALKSVDSETTENHAEMSSTDENLVLDSTTSDSEPSSMAVGAGPATTERKVEHGTSTASDLSATTLRSTKYDPQKYIFLISSLVLFISVCVYVLFKRI